MKSLLFGLMSIFLISNVESFSGSVPPLKSVCDNMIPHHEHVTPQASPAPFQIIPSGPAVKAGETLTVTLKSTQSGIKFKGFYVQARDGNNKPVGSFANNDDAKTHNCGRARSNAAHHANGKVEKSSATLVWTAPKDYVGDVTFVGTFVKQYTEIWAGVQASPVAVTRSGTKL